MVIAIVNGKRLRAEDAGSGTIGLCPWTRREVKAKVGEIRQYWAYIGGQPNLPEGYENETEWHYNWKNSIKDEYCEVICGEKNEHRADIIGNKQTVVEIQKSPIDIRIVRERIDFYEKLSKKRVIWVVDASEYWNTRLKVLFKERQGNTYPVYWKPIRRWVVEIAKTTQTNLYLDFNTKSDKLLQMWVHDKNLKSRFITKVDFFKNYLVENAKDEYKENPERILKDWE